MTGTIAIAVSGGIDSLVCAYLLKQHTDNLFAIHFLTGYEDSPETLTHRIETLFAELDIPVAVVDLADDFNRRVVDYFIDAYHRGRTPNPCLVCNPDVKFGVLFDHARRLGAARLATGHYARVTAGSDGRFRLLKGVDPAKDQSYFLSRLTQVQLERAVFPLGTWTKASVRKLAAEQSLVPLVRQESQDVCFIRESAYADFLEHRAGRSFEPGDIVDVHGKRVGRHHGLHRYTIGQRRGINCPASQAYYVVGIDARQNRLIVGFKDHRYTNGCKVTDVNWIAGLPEGPVALNTRIRYRHQGAAATVVPDGPDRAIVSFDTPQASVTPGQGAVFYRGEEVVGGGWIE
jgi:tRNA-uridine 2-sulfurtransferase